MILVDWENIFRDKITALAEADDPAHDLLHFKRVVKSAKKLGELENAKLEVIVPAAWLHDFINVPKNDPRRSEASKLSAEAAIQFLKTIHYPEEFYARITHAIEAHSFSANIEPTTIEAKIVQDADRLDALGAIGIARCFSSAGTLKRAYYSEIDPFCKERTPDDQVYTLDHFYRKLLKVAETLQTDAGRQEGKRRGTVIRNYLEALSLEIS